MATFGSGNVLLGFCCTRAWSRSASALLLALNLDLAQQALARRPAGAGASSHQQAAGQQQAGLRPPGTVNLLDKKAP